MSTTPQHSTQSPRNYVRASWTLLVVNLLVILGGAFVRASGSGDGCGQHWPLCHGQVVPLNAEPSTWIEYSHRLSSGISLLLAAAVFFAARRFFERSDQRRRAAGLVFGLTLIEAGIGAALVLLALVNQNASVWRVVVVGLHLINTFLLVGACTMNAVYASGETARLQRSQFRSPLAFGMYGLLLTAAFGAMAAVGDFLYPSESLRHGLAQDFSPNAPLFVRLRILHPIIAVLTATFLFYAKLPVALQEQHSKARMFARALLALLLLQLALGLGVVYHLAPLHLQLSHLLIADLIWILCTLLLIEEASAIAKLDNRHAARKEAVLRAA